MPLRSFRNVEYFRTFSQTAQVWAESCLPPLQNFRDLTWEKNTWRGLANLWSQKYGAECCNLDQEAERGRCWRGGCYLSDGGCLPHQQSLDLASWEDDFCVQRTCSWGHRHFPHRCCQVADSSQHEEGTSGDVIQNSALVEQEDDHFGGSWDETPLLQPYFWWTIQEILQIGQIVCILNLEQYDTLTTCSKHIWAISFCVCKAQTIHDTSKSLKNTTQVGRTTWNLLI